MYGTVIRLQPIQERKDEILADTRRWIEERGAAVGFVGEYVLTPDERPNEWIVFVIFESEEQYRENAASPEQDRWYRRLRAGLLADPEWTDGAVIALEPASVPL